MSLESRIIDLANAIGTDIKTIYLTIGDLTALNTTNKTDIVSAINEALTTSGEVTQNDLNVAIQQVKDDLTGGASATLDTLKELEDALGGDDNFAVTIAEQISKRVRFDSAQTLTTAQKLTACQNIGVGDPERNFVSTYNTAKA